MHVQGSVLGSAIEIVKNKYYFYPNSLHFDYCKPKQERFILFQVFRSKGNRGGFCKYNKKEEIFEKLTILLSKTHLGSEFICR